MQNCLRAVESFIQNVPPRCLDYTNAKIRGRLRPNMKKVDRFVHWDQPVEYVARKIRMSDSSPGAVARLRFPKRNESWSEEFRVFGAHIEEEGLQHIKGQPGEVIGKRDNAVLVKCLDGAVWVSHLKKNKLKLPATFYVDSCAISHFSVNQERSAASCPRTFQEIWTTVSPDSVCVKFTSSFTMVPCLQNNASGLEVLCQE